LWEEDGDSEGILFSNKKKGDNAIVLEKNWEQKECD